MKNKSKKEDKEPKTFLKYFLGMCVVVKMGCDIHLYVEKKINREWVYADKIDVGRDYELFGFLAGVRGEQQHFEQKGFPDDASPKVREICEGYGVDGHSHSWLTLEELQTVGWEDDKVMIKESGIMANKQWEKFQETIKIGKPDYSLRFPYWGAGEYLETPSSYHEWEVPITIEFKHFYEEVVKRLPTYCRDCKPNEIRIVFWFDN